jgi:neutral ceramidase
MQNRMVLVGVLVLFLSHAACAAEPGFRAGAATSNITPMLGEPIIGNFTTPKAERIHDELHARCLVLDDGSTRLAIVVCDNLGISREVLDEAKWLIKQAAGIPLEHVLISSTHTHSGTSARWDNALRPKDYTDYQLFVARRIADGVRRAINNLEPAQVGWGAADEPRAVFNRRYRMRPGVELLNPLGGTDRVKMNPGLGNPDVVEPAGPVDPQASFLSVRSKEGGRPIALLANYSLHYVGGMPSNEISADYFAVFADKVGRKLGAAERQDPPFVGVMSNGTSGDINNIDVLGKQLRPAKQKPYEQIDRVAEMLAEAVSQAHLQVKFHDHVPLRSAQRELLLKVRKPTPEMIARAKGIVAGELKPVGNLDATYAKRILDLADSPDDVSVPLQALAIGDLGIAAIPFEVFAETGLEIKAKSPFKPTFTISQANGSYGYLPTPEQHKLGGYETWLGTNRVEQQGSVKIVDTLLDLFATLQKSP